MCAYLWVTQHKIIAFSLQEVIIFVLSWKQIVGDNADPISWYTVVGFLLILIGFLVKGKPNEETLDDNEIESNLLNQTDDENNMLC